MLTCDGAGNDQPFQVGACVARMVAVRCIHLRECVCPRRESAGKAWTTCTMYSHCVAATKCILPWVGKALCIMPDFARQL